MTLATSDTRSCHTSVTEILFTANPSIMMMQAAAGEDKPMAGSPSFNCILVVEDDPDIREMLRFTLTRAGYDVWEAESAEAGLARLDGQLPAMVLIDWMLPGMQGTELARRLRQDDHTSNLPLMMLTARGAEEDKLKSFDIGIDDYLTKPFSPRELVARIKALLRRSGAPENSKLSSVGMELDLEAHQLLVNGEVVHIGPTEFRLLEFFMANPERAFDRNTLLNRVWGRGVYVEERTVDVHVLRLRRVLKPHGMQHHIETVRGVGYRFKP